MTSECNFFEIKDHFSSNKDTDANKSKTFTSSEKWWISLVLALIFLIISSPFVYSLTSSLSSLLNLPPLYVMPGGTTAYGLFWHTIFFFLIVRIIMG